MNILKSVVIMSVFLVLSITMSAQEEELKGKKYRFVVTVVNAATNETIQQANVSIAFIGKYQQFINYEGGGIARQSLPTNQEGKTYLLYEDNGSYRITVDHPEYETEEKFLPVSGKYRDIPTTFLLKKKKVYKKIVFVTVTAADDGRPIIDASVNFEAEFLNIYRVSTNRDGIAAIEITKGAKNFEVEIRHSQFKPLFNSFSPNDEQEQYQLSFQMIRTGSSEEYDDKKDKDDEQQKKDKDEKNQKQQPLVIAVYDKHSRPVPNATLNLADGQVIATNENGRCEVQHKFLPGSITTVKATAPGYKSISVEHSLWDFDEGNVQDLLFIVMEPEQEEDEITIQLMVLKDDQGKTSALENAKVHLPDGKIMATNNIGIIQTKQKFKFRDAIETHSYPVNVEAAGYTSKSETILVSKPIAGIGDSKTFYHMITLSGKGEKLQISVYGKTKDGSSAAVAKAKISLPDGQVLFTDATGYCEAKHNFAKEVEIKINVEAAGYKSQTASRAANLADGFRSGVRVTLEPLANQNTQGWAGTWLGNSKRSVYLITGEAEALSGSYNYDLPGTYHANAKGNGTFSNCRKEGDLIICDWTGYHEDDDKTISQSGRIFLKLYGDRLDVRHQYLADGAVNWKPNRPRYDPEAAKNWFFDVKLERAKLE